ncbi:hypothetical protein L6452_14419 [Arctium lappa]|uniref:Uncharacterized protein n=1 Tax=Arctium lappa TaxID=4217 RepID=A0ACB9CLF6_ARCLA|nr:hypothetical protein L6452_14419 [Arctium lappa]
MAECSGIGCCNVNFLRKIKNTDMIRNINWSRYIFECLKQSKIRWRNDTYDNFHLGPLTFLTLLYVESTACNIKDMPTRVPPLQRWNMDYLRERLATGIKEGGLDMAKLQEPLAARSQRAREKRPVEREPTPDSPVDGEDTPNSPEDVETVKKFALLMKTKVDAQTLILRAKEIFPDEDMFERYEDDLSILFNVHGSGGSSGRRTKGMHNHHTTSETSNAQKGDGQPPFNHTASALCTPTKLDFDGV